MSRNKITIPISQCSNLKTAETKALIDSGAEGKFVNGTIVKWKNVIHLKKPITVRNVDGTHNEMGKIRYKTKICYNMKRNQFEDWFYVTKLGDQKVILGLPWLKQVNPDIDWSTGTVSFPEERSINDDPEGEELEDDETDTYLRTILKEEELDADANEDLETDHLWIQAKTSASQALTHEYEDNAKKAELPPEYAKWRKVFDKQTLEQFPILHPWDHAIELKDGFKPKISKIYLLNIHEDQLMNKWIDKQSKKGYIRESTSQQASPFFYVAKKEKGELRPCQDYRYTVPHKRFPMIG